MISLFNFFGIGKKNTHEVAAKKELTEDEKGLLLAIEIVAKDLSSKTDFKMLK